MNAQPQTAQLLNAARLLRAGKSAPVPIFQRYGRHIVIVGYRQERKAA
jgi:hypothetical protein